MQGSESVNKTTFQQPWEQTEFRNRSGSVGRDAVDGRVHDTVEVTEEQDVCTTGSILVDVGGNPLMELLKVRGVRVGALWREVAVDYCQLEAMLETEQSPDASSVQIGECCCE